VLSKSQAKAFFLGGTVVFGGIFIALTIDSMRQVPKMTREENMTHQVVAGKKIWDKNNCMGCHTLFGEGAYYAPELTKAYVRRGEPWLKVFLKDPEAMFPGERKMVNYHFSDEEIGAVVAFLKWAGEVDLNGFPADPPLKQKMGGVTSNAGHGNLNVSSSDGGPKPPGVYQALCVACHALQGSGGTIGPALDSVFARKSREEIAAWLADPAKIKPGTLMPKLPLTEAQIDSLAGYLSDLGGAQ
jgi:nitric oxide reductase subunit C